MKPIKICKKCCRNRIINLLTALFIFAFQNSVYGQSYGFKVDRLCINPKLGFYNWAENDGGFIKGIELNILKSKKIYSLDYYKYEELTLFGPTPDEPFTQLGLMIGEFKGDKFFKFQYQAGLSVFWGFKRTKLIKKGSGMFSSDKYESDNFFTCGLVTKLGFKIIPFTFLAFGLDLQTNLNFENTVYMPLISIEIGKLRNKINEPYIGI